VDEGRRAVRERHRTRPGPAAAAADEAVAWLKVVMAHLPVRTTPGPDEMPSTAPRTLRLWTDVVRRDRPGLPSGPRVPAGLTAWQSGEGATRQTSRSTGPWPRLRDYSLAKFDCATSWKREFRPQAARVP